MYSSIYMKVYVYNSVGTWDNATNMVGPALMTRERVKGYTVHIRRYRTTDIALRGGCCNICTAYHVAPIPRLCSTMRAHKAYKCDIYAVYTNMYSWAVGFSKVARCTIYTITMNVPWKYVVLEARERGLACMLKGSGHESLEGTLKLGIGLSNHTVYSYVYLSSD
jgi:hypothetical protein